MVKLHLTATSAWVLVAHSVPDPEQTHFHVKLSSYCYGGDHPYWASLQVQKVVRFAPPTISCTLGE